jgi:hypothetical protein
MLQFTNIPESDFSLGIDARSAENQIAPGFVEDLLNADVIERRARKRKGYQGFAGNIPVRVKSFTYDDNDNLIYFDLDSSIDLGNIRSTPLVVYGRSSKVLTGGPFTTAGDTAKYYTGFTVPTKKTMLATAGAPPYEVISVPASEHDINTTDMFLGIAEATSPINRSYQVVIPHDIVIDGTSKDVDIEYQNSTGVDKEVFVYYKDVTPVTGQIYKATLSHTGSGSESFSIPTGTHGLANFNIVAQIQQDLTTEVSVVLPHSLTVAPNGDVTIVLDTDTAGDFYAILATTDIPNQVSGNIGALSTGTIVIPALSNPWAFYSIYLEEISGGNKEQVFPDTVVYDDVTGDVTLSFVNNTTTAKNVIAYYLYGTTRSNQIAVSDSTVSVDDTDPSPQLTIWGLDHLNLYGDTALDYAGWANHIDSYRSAGEQRIITGLGGNLFNAKTYSEAGTTYKYAQLLPNVNARTSVATKLGPVFYDTSDTPARTNGYITSDNSGTNWASITSVSYDVSNGWTKYVLSLPNKQVLDSAGVPTSLSSVISVAANLEDYLTTSDLGYKRFNGTFKIKQILDQTDAITLWVDNPGVTGTDYDDLYTQGEGAIFTDRITWSASSPFLPGDLLSSAAFADSQLTVSSSDGATSVLSGVTELISVAPGIATTASRESDVIPLRTAQPNAAASVVNLVAGDMLSYATTDDSWDGRLLRVLYINPDQDRSIDITADGSSATVTLDSGDTSYLMVGSKILLNQAGPYDGTQIVTSIPTADSFTFDTSLSETISNGTLRGGTAQLDESFSWDDTSDDSTGFTVDSRWLPIEAPDDSYDLTPSTHVTYFNSGDYDSQEPLKSTMVQNNMYLTNFSDPVYKLDGVNNYRAGLPSWQAGLFLTVDTAATAKIVADNPSTTPTAFADGIFTVTLGEEQKYLVGQYVRHSYSGGFDDYQVASTYDNGTDGFVKIVRTKTSTLGTSPSLTLLSARRYYLRLNAVDANNNLIASATTGYQDHVAFIAEDAAINLKGVGLPTLDVYDYARLEVEIYGTKLNTPAPFYKLTTLPLDFNNTKGYFNYTDSFADSDLIDLDIVNTALKGAELGTLWQDPLRAKFVTSIGNRLVLGYLKDYPQLDIQLIASGAVSNTTYTGKIFTFRKDNTDTANTTFMPDRVRYELLDTAGATAVTAASGSAGASFTVTVNNTAVAGDWVYLFWSTVEDTGTPLTYSGWWQIASANATTITIRYTDAPAGDITADVPDSALFATDPTDIPVPLGTDGNLGMVNGDSFDLFDLGRRLSMAINASMRMVDADVTGMDSFSPWLTAKGGNDVGKSGRIIVRQPKVLSTNLEVQLPSSFSGGGESFSVFVNDVRRSASQQVSATTKLFPSRLLVSYENFPEIFDNPTSILDSESDSAIDINSADGQEMTGVMPFFGEAAFGAAQQSAVLVVFKTNSIYLVDINEKLAGRNPVQRIETEGLGCTAPGSIAVTKNGIIFANQSGIYCLRRNQTIEYIGKYMERKWTEQIDLSLLSLAKGHHYGVGRVYKLSLPLKGGSKNTEVFVYNHTGEAEGRPGSWARYDNHPATGWANLGADAFFSTSNGRVFSVRNTGTKTDFRDDNQAILFKLDTRAIDFGNAGIRKVLDKAIINYRTIDRSVGTEVLFSVDLAEEFTASTAIIIPKRTTDTGIDDSPNQSVYPIEHSTGRRKGIYHQIRVTNNTLDEGPEITGMDLRVGGLNSSGIVQASETQSK